MADYVQKISSGYVYKFMSNSILATSEPKLTQCALPRESPWPPAQPGQQRHTRIHPGLLGELERRRVSEPQLAWDLRCHLVG